MYGRVYIYIVSQRVRQSVHSVRRMYGRVYIVYAECTIVYIRVYCGGGGGGSGGSGGIYRVYVECTVYGIVYGGVYGRVYILYAQCAQNVKNHPKHINRHNLSLNQDCKIVEGSLEAS